MKHEKEYRKLKGCFFGIAFTDGTLSMTDKERMYVVERCYTKMKRYRNLVSYYTNKNISVSYLRAKKKNDLDRVMGLYGSANERYW